MSQKNLNTDSYVLDHQVAQGHPQGRTVDQAHTERPQHPIGNHHTGQLDTDHTPDITMPVTSQLSLSCIPHLPLITIISHSPTGTPTAADSIGVVSALMIGCARVDAVQIRPSNSDMFQRTIMDRRHFHRGNSFVKIILSLAVMEGNNRVHWPGLLLACLCAVALSDVSSIA